MDSRTADHESQQPESDRGGLGRTRSMRLTSPRGPVTAALAVVLRSPVDQPPIVSDLPAQIERAIGASPDVLVDGDLQLALFWLYELQDGGIADVDERWEWQRGMLACRAAIEHAVEAALREQVSVPKLPATADAEGVAQALFALTTEGDEQGLSHFVCSDATEAQARELLISRSIYTLKEADPDSCARALEAAGLDPEYGRYVDLVNTRVLTALNTITLFGLHQRLRGAFVGHLAAFEMISSLPRQRIAAGLRRLGFAPEVADYYDVHIETDAVHEQIAGRDLAGGLVDDEPELLPDVLFGAAASLAVDGWVADHMLAAWTDGRSALRTPPRTHRALVARPKTRIPSTRRLVRDSG